ncbi:methyltransferase domain-containing protein [Streptomyces sp. NPDC059651]|uniref:methyltransferase domain-containing protein n=1 Tax=Streptomyces sp. NPDC059651 TaxID=3346897 RepID=UPI0036BB9C78
MAVTADKEYRLDPTTLRLQDSRGLLRELPGHLVRAGFNERSACQLLGAPSPEHLIANTTRYAFFADFPHIGTPPSAADVLTALFVLNRPLATAVVDKALDPALRDLLQEARLLNRSEGVCRGLVSLTPYRSRYFLSDPLFSNPSPQTLHMHAASDLAMPPHASTLIALDTVGTVNDSFLDVGCGSGFLALNAVAGHGHRAGIDLNPRSVAYASANAELNSDRVSFEQANFATHTVPSSERFGALLFNAPTRPCAGPEDGEFGQATAEQVLRTTAEAAPRLLRPDGMAHVLTLIEVPRRFGSVTDTIHHWLADTPATEVTVTELDDPRFVITEAQLRNGRCHGQSILAAGAAQGERLVSALRARDVVSVALVRVALRSGVDGGWTT